MQTRENRIFRHYKSLAKSNCCADHPIHMATKVWMILARRWKMPIREVKRIVAEEKERRRNEP